MLVLKILYIWFISILVDREAHMSSPISKEQANEQVLTVVRFINSCVAEHIRLAPDKCIHLYFASNCIWYPWCHSTTFILLGNVNFDFAVISVCKKFKDQIMLLEAPMRGVAPLLTAMRKLQSSSEHLTTLHPDFLLLCLLAKCYRSGLCILDDDIFEVDQPRDLFLYCYYG